MAKDADVLESLMTLSSKERAAALAHWIYVQTTHRGDNKWSLRVAESWSDLEVKPKQFNIATIDTWAEHPQLLDAWISAVNSYREEVTRSRRNA